MLEYSEFIDGWIAKTGPCPLDAGEIDRSFAEALGDVDDQTLFGDRISDSDAALCCKAGLWLRANDLDQSHRISQGVSTSEGSYWHAIMHRREPDYSNSLYWFRRVGAHPVFELLAADALAEGERLGEQKAASALVAGKSWNPSAFGELCRVALTEGGRLEEFGVAVQAAEWRRLFDFCFRKAVGA